jgi:hypothetical protein
MLWSIAEPLDLKLIATLVAHMLHLHLLEVSVCDRIYDPKRHRLYQDWMTQPCFPRGGKGSSSYFAQRGSQT